MGDWYEADRRARREVEALSDDELQARAAALLGQMRAHRQQVRAHRRRCHEAHLWWLRSLDDLNRAESRWGGLMDERRRILAEDGLRRTFVIVGE